MGCVMHFVLSGCHPFGDERDRQIRIQNEESSLFDRIHDVSRPVPISDESISKLIILLKQLL